MKSSIMYVRAGFRAKMSVCRCYENLNATQLSQWRRENLIEKKKKTTDCLTQQSSLFPAFPEYLTTLRLQSFS